MYSARDFASSSGIMYILVAAGYTAAVFVVLYLTVPLFWKEKARAACIVQGGYRGNVILFAIPIVESVCGPDLVGIVSVCASVVDRKSTRLNSSHPTTSRMPSSA